MLAGNLSHNRRQSFLNDPFSTQEKSSKPVRLIVMTDHNIRSPNNTLRLEEVLDHRYIRCLLLRP